MAATRLEFYMRQTIVPATRRIATRLHPQLQQPHIPPFSRHVSYSTISDVHSFDHTTDVLVIGSGSAALTAAVRSRSLGMDTLVVEKTDKLGGTSAYSGGGVWIPCSHIQAQHGVHDSRENAATYIDTIVKEEGPATSPARRAAYLDQVPVMAKFLEDQGFRWTLDMPYPDYHALEPGAHTTSRSHSPAAFDLRELDATWRKRLRTPTDWQPVMSGVESRSLFRIGASVQDFLNSVNVVLSSSTNSRASLDPNIGFRVS